MKSLKFLNLPKHCFEDREWVNFDQVSITDIQKAIFTNCIYKETDHHATILESVTSFPELFVFGAISPKGEIVLKGFSGMPFSSGCVTHATNLVDSAIRSQISHYNVWMEFID